MGRQVFEIESDFVISETLISALFYDYWHKMGYQGVVKVREAIGSGGDIRFAANSMLVDPYSSMDKNANNFTFGGESVKGTETLKYFIPTIDDLRKSREVEESIRKSYFVKQKFFYLSLDFFRSIWFWGLSLFFVKKEK